MVMQRMPRLEGLDSKRWPSGLEFIRPGHAWGAGSFHSIFRSGREESNRTRNDERVIVRKTYGGECKEERNQKL